MSLARRLSRSRRARWGADRRWSEGSESELDFWRRWLTTGGAEWSYDYEWRLDPEAEVQEILLRQCLPDIEKDIISVLDVGAGPLTTVGQRHEGRELRVTAIDPLADEYNEVIDEAGVEPPTRTQRGTGEELLDLFEPETFDVACASNALDHGADPALSVRNMLDVVVPGGFVALRHFRNEAETREYSGLHGWNLDERQGDLVAWKPGGETVEITAPLRSRATVRCEMSDQYVLCLLHKDES